MCPFPQRPSANPANPASAGRLVAAPRRLAAACHFDGSFDRGPVRAWPALCQRRARGDCVFPLDPGQERASIAAYPLSTQCRAQTEGPGFPRRLRAAARFPKTYAVIEPV
jgi:hypothetical protein